LRANTTSSVSLGWHLIVFDANTFTYYFYDHFGAVQVFLVPYQTILTDWNTTTCSLGASWHETNTVFKGSYMIMHTFGMKETSYSAATV